MRTEKLIVTTLLSVNFVFGGWQYQKTISISNTNELLQNYQVFVELTPTNFQYDHCLGTRGSDIRFSTNPYGSISPDIPHWIQDWNNNDTSSIWINVPNIAADSTTDIYMYYGGNDTISTSNGKSTFEVFEDFIFDNGEWIENDPNSRILLDYSGDERLEFNAWERSDPGAVYKSYSPPASFVFEYDFNMTDGWGNRNSPGPMFGDQLGSFTDQQNCIFISYWIGSAQPRVQFKYKVDGAHTQVGEIFISETIQYYGRITKKTAGDNIQLVYELFSDSDRQNHVSGSPLNTYYQSNGINTDYMFLVNTGSWNNSDTENSTGWMDNYIIKKTAASDPNVAVSTTETEGFWTLESSGLIAYYPFNNSPSDESGNGNDGDIIGAIITTDRFDNDNSAYSFTNSIETDQNRIQVSGPNGFLGGDPFTSLAFAAWFKAPIQTDNCSYILRIASSDGTCYLSYEDNGSVAFNLRKTQDGTLNQVLYASAIPDRWHFVVGNWDGQIQEIYLDGILIDSAIFDWPISVASTGNTIGANYANSASECSFNGHIDDIRIYDRALTADEIDSLYHIGGWGTQIDTGPMAYYPFNGNANDESGNDHDGTVNGAILTTDRFGNANSAYDFNNDNINIRQGWNSESGSISMWVYRTGSGVQRFLSDRNSSQDYISLFVNSSNMVGATIYGNSFEDIGQTIVLSQNRWYHAVVNWGTGGMQLYINGQLNDSSTNTQSWNATSDLLIGNSQAYPTQGWNGKIDDIHIFDHALTELEIDSLYHLGGWPLPDLVAYYPFSGNANDESGNGNHGTVNGATPTSDRFGNTESAYAFNGISDYITMGNIQNAPTNDYTLNCWVKTVDDEGVIIRKRPLSGTGFRMGLGTGAEASNGRLNNEIQDHLGNIQIHESISTVNDDRWHMVTGVKEDTTILIYIDNNLVPTSLYYSTGALIGSLHNVAELIIGRTQGSTNWFDGKIDDIHIFDHALTELEIDSLYHLGGWPLPDLVAYYPFSGNANDESGNGNHGVPATQSPTLTTDRFGNLNSAYSFEGTDDYFLLPDSLLYQLNTVSFFAWANVSSISSHGSILSCALDQSASACQELLNFKPDTVLGCQIACFNADVNIFYDIPDFECGEWVFVGFTYDGDTISSWYNGQLAETSAFSGGAIKLYGHTAIGRRVGGAWDFNGLIDDVSIYSRAINASEIDSLYHLVGWPLPAAPQNLIASSSDQAVVLTWNQNSESDLLKYNIYKGIDNSTITLLDSVLNPIPIDTIYVDNDVTFGEAYHYYVTAVIQSGIESNPSNEVIIKLDSYPVVAGIPDQVIHEAEEFADFDLDDYLIEQDGDSIIWNYSIQSGSPPPDWSIEPSDFEYDMSLTGLIQFNGIESQDSLDQVAAFVGDECRGIANPVYFPVTGSYLIGMVIFSNQVSGELVEFKAYDASTGIVGIVLESYVFTSNVIIGSGLTPEILTCTYQPNEPELFVSIDDSNIVDVSYLEGWFGTGTIIFSAMDYTVNEYSDSDSAVFTVLETENSPPELDIPASVEMLEDDTVRITLVASDVDEDTLTFYAEIDTSAIHLDVVDSILILIPQGNWYGNASILVTVSDGYETDSSNINLQVLPVNDPPGQFSLSTPANEYTWYDTSVVTFDWGNSIDIDGDSVKYIFHVYNSQYETYIQCDSSFYIAIYDSVEFPIGTLLSWNVFATDGIDTVSSNEDHWVFLIIQVGTVEDGVIPTQFALHQNYPNPFNPITTIQYDLPERSEIQITVLDLLGRKVITLVSEIQDAGYKSVKWNATNSLGQSVSAGVYFYQIIAGDYVQTRKMVLLK